MKRAATLLLAVAAFWVSAPVAMSGITSPTSWFKSGGKPEVTVQKKKSSALTRPLSKMSDGTKRLVSGTKSVLTPKSASIRRTGTTGVQKAKTTEQPKQGFFKSMFNPDPPPVPRTPQEFMRLKQIHP